MTASSEVISPEDTRQAQLDSLAASIVLHHHAVQGHARATLDHVIACGEDLIQARNIVPQGQWRAWLRENVGLDKGTVGMYQRIATFSDELRAAGIDKVQAAREYVRDHDLILSISNTGRATPPEIVLEIRALGEQGLSHRKIGRQLGVGKTSVGRILRNERHKGKDTPRSRNPRLRRKRVAIDDDMIEGMAMWLCAAFDQFPQDVSDEVRHLALEALGSAFQYVGIAQIAADKEKP